jgi:hypothetical protein
MADDIRRLVWDSLLSADYRARYYGHLASVMESFDENLTIGVTIASSGAFVVIVTRLPWWVGAVVSLVAAVMSIILSVKKFGKLGESSATLHKGWSSIESDYEVLWAQADSLPKEELLTKWRQVKSREEALEESLGMKFHLRRDLIEKSKQEVLEQRRLASA